MEDITYLQLPTHPYHPLHHPPARLSLLCAIHDITAAVKKVAQNPIVLHNYVASRNSYKTLGK